MRPPLVGIPERLAALRPLKLTALAGGAGAFGALAQEPFGIAPLIMVMIAAGSLLHTTILRARLSNWQAAGIGWALGFAYFTLSLSWIVHPFQVDPTTAWMAPFGLVLMGAGMALFWGAAFGIARFFGRTWAIALCWSGAELLRAYVFTGFPWASPPQALVSQVFGQSLAWIGPHGLMLAMCLLGLLIASALTNARHAIKAAGVAVLALFAIPFQGADPKMTPHSIRLVQPNAPQVDKWDPDKAWTFVRRALEQTAQTGTPDLILWPETAVPTLLHNAENVMQAVAEAGGDTPVALGILREREDGMLTNAIVVLDSAGGVAQSYDKHHLVPFGEYIPMRAAFNAIGLQLIGDMFGDGFGRGAGAELLDFGPLGTALPLICYEAVFAHDVNAAPTRPDFLIQITNDAWFGDRAGPLQHLAQARMRTIEQGLPMARAANTGISAMIGPRGQILAALPLNTANHLDAVLPQPLPATLYSKTGDRPLAILFILVALMCLIGRIRAPYVN